MYENILNIGVVGKGAKSSAYYVAATCAKPMGLGQKNKNVFLDP